MEFGVMLANLTGLTNTTLVCESNPLETDVLFYLLAGFAVIVFGMDVWQLVRLMIISRETGLKYSAKRLFHWVLGFSLLGRAGFFFVSPSLCSLPQFPWVYLYVWLNHTLEVLFFFAFFLLVAFWTDLITSLKGPGRVTTPLFLKVALIVFIVVLGATCLMFMGLFLGLTEQVLILDVYFAVLVNVLSVSAALLFLVLGIILYRLLRKTDQLLTVNVEKKKSMAKTVFLVTALCTICFAFRVVVSIYSIAQEWNGSGTSEFDVPAPVFFLYFFLPEICGSSLMLFLLRVPKTTRTAFGGKYATVQDNFRGIV